MTEKSEQRRKEMEKANSWWGRRTRTYWARRSQSYVLHEPSVYLTLLGFGVFLGAFGLVMMIVFISMSGYREEFVPFGIVGGAGIITFILIGVGFNLYHHYAGKAPLGWFPNSGVHTLRLSDLIRKLVEVPDLHEDENGISRQTTYWTGSNYDALEEWQEARGGGHRGAHVEAMANIREKLNEKTGKWEIMDAFCIGHSALVIDGKTPDGKPTTMTVADLVKKFNATKPYIDMGRKQLYFPYDYRARHTEDAPIQVQEQIIRKLPNWNINMPLDIGWDVLPEYGGTGMNLPSQAEWHFWDNERLIADGQDVIQDQRTGLFTHERQALGRGRKDYDDFRKENE